MITILIKIIIHEIWNKKNNIKNIKIIYII